MAVLSADSEDLVGWTLEEGAGLVPVGGELELESLPFLAVSLLCAVLVFKAAEPRVQWGAPV